MDRRIFRKQQIRPVQRQVSVNLIRGYLVIPGDSVLPAGIHQHSRTHDIRLQEDARIINAAVHVGFRREIHNHIRMLFLKQPVHRFTVTDIRLHKPETRVIHHAFHRREIPRIGQFVQADDPVFRIFFQHMKYKVGSDKTRAACYDNRHKASHFFPFFILRIVSHIPRIILLCSR